MSIKNLGFFKPIWYLFHPVSTRKKRKFPFRWETQVGNWNTSCVPRSHLYPVRFGPRIPYWWHNTTQILAFSSDFLLARENSKPSNATQVSVEQYGIFLIEDANEDAPRDVWVYFQSTIWFVLIVVFFCFVLFFSCSRKFSRGTLFLVNSYSVHVKIRFGRTGAREFSGTQAVIVFIDSYNRFVICSFIIICILIVRYSSSCCVREICIN